MNQRPVVGTNCLLFQTLLMRVLKGCLASALMVSFLGCAGLKESTSSASGPHEVRTSEFNQDADWVASMGVSGKLALAHYDEQRRIHLVDLTTGVSTMPFHPQGSNRASSSLALGWLGGDAYVGFRDKEPVRDVFVAPVKKPEQLVGLGTDTVALARLKMVSMPDALGVLWYGEPRAGADKAYDIFYRELNANGQPTGAAEALFEGIYPVIARTSAGRTTAFTWVQKDGQDRILARSKLPGQAWGAVTTVAEVGPVLPVFDAIADGDRTTVFWHAQYGADRSDYRLEGATSVDGLAWTRFHLKGFDGWDIESASFAADGQGNVAVAAAIVRPGGYQTDKMRVRLLVSHDAGATWSDPIDVRQDPLQPLDKVYSHARAPKVEFLGAGKLMVAWQDWRSLRSAIHYSYSEDAGRTWAVSDRRLSPLGDVQERFAQNQRTMFAHDGRLHVIVESLSDDSLKQKRLVHREFSSADLLKMATLPQTDGPAPDPERLKVRMVEYWTAMGARDFEKTYSMMEPYFRSTVTYGIYKEKLGRIDYVNPTAKFTEIYGPLGMGVVKVTVEVKPIVIKRKTTKLDPVDREVPGRWMWIDGDWYMIFNSEYDEARYTPF